MRTEICLDPDWSFTGVVDSLRLELAVNLSFANGVGIGQHLPDITEPLD
ncbi:hypothetical protein ABZ342_21560 [Amycolatopsis sp. NPDC005961]